MRALDGHPAVDLADWRSGGGPVEALAEQRTAGGIHVGYQNLRFTTLKGIGHMARKCLICFFVVFCFLFFCIFAAQFGPTQSFTMLKNYLNGHTPVSKMRSSSRAGQGPHRAE